MGKIDRTGTFIGTVLESTLGQSSSGFPQWVARLKATKKHVTEKSEMEHFGITEPGYVDWSGYDESIVAFLVLFNDKGPLLNYDQLIAATGWSGQDFQDLTGFGGKTVLFRVEENAYKDKVTLQVSWIDAEDAPPERQLKSVDVSATKALNAKFLTGIAKPAKPAKPVPAKAVAAATDSPATTAAAPAAKIPPAPKNKRPPAQEEPSALPKETTKDDAWAHLNAPQVRGDVSENDIAEAWIAATAEVGPTTDEDKFTPQMWASVRDIVIKDLDLK